MRKPRPGRKNPAPPPQKRASGRPVSILGVVTLLAVGLLLGLLINSLRQDGPPAPPPGTSRGQMPLLLEGELGEQWRAATARWCPRLAGLQWGDSGQPSTLALELVSIECLGLMCEHPEKLEAVSPSARSQLKPVCERLGSLLGAQMTTVTADYRHACPEAVQTWSGRTWSPSNHLGFHEDVRQCLERQCEGVDGGRGSETRCELAADIAEGLGDTRSAARLRERARLAKEREKQEWEALSPEEQKESIDQGMKVLAKRLLEACRQGNERYCRSLARYCELEGHPPDVCPR